MEDVIEFLKWKEKMIKDAKEQLKITDETFAFEFLRDGIAFYFKTLGKCYRCSVKKE